MTDLTHKHCVPCEGGDKPLTDEQIAAYIPGLTKKWKVTDGKKISFEFQFKNFIETMKFINKVAEIAESEGHHPDMHVYYGKALIELWTHEIGGLSENDFIMAARIEAAAE